MSSPNIIVPIKQVPDMEEVEFDREEGRIDRSSAGVETNPFCANALEEAMRYKEEVGGEITSISMGPPSAESSLRDALAIGADRAILLTDKNFAASDTWATAYTLASAIRKLENFDLIICGEKTIDGDTGQVGPEIAEFLDIPHIAYVSGVKERSKEEIIVKSEMFGGAFLKKMKLPGLITVTKDVNEPRIPTLKNKMSARKAEIEEWGAESLSDFTNPENFGVEGSKTRVRKITVPSETEREGLIFREEPTEFVENVIYEFEGKGLI